MVADHQAEIAASVAALQDLGPGYDQALADPGAPAALLMEMEMKPRIHYASQSHLGMVARRKNQ